MPSTGLFRLLHAHSAHILKQTHTHIKKKNKNFSQVQWPMSLIPAPGRQSKQISAFEGSQGYTVKCCGLF